MSKEFISLLLQKYAEFRDDTVIENIEQAQGTWIPDGNGGWRQHKCDYKNGVFTLVDLNGTRLGNFTLLARTLDTLANTIPLTVEAFITTNYGDTPDYEGVSFGGAGISNGKDGQPAYKIHISAGFIEAIDDKAAETMLHALNLYITEKKFFDITKEGFKELTGSTSDIYESKHEGVSRLIFRFKISDDTKKHVDPIHDFSNKLNAAIGINAFSQTTYLQPLREPGSSQMNTDLLIEPLNISRLLALSPGKRQLIKDAIANPREFVQEQRKNSGIGGTIQAAFDRTVLSWSTKVQPEKTPVSSAVKQ